MASGQEPCAAAKETQEGEEEGDDEVVIEEVEQDSSAGPAGSRQDDGEGTTAEENEIEAQGSEEANGNNSTDKEIDKIEKEKSNMTVVEKLERSILWKAEGNDFFKKSEVFKAVDAYYHAVLYCRDLTQNPQYYPNLKHNEEQRKMAQDICESCFANLALCQYKYGEPLAAGDPERSKVLGEAEKSATEALKLNPKNVKALYRRALARTALGGGPLTASLKTEEAQKILQDAKTDLLAIIEIDQQNRDARSTLKSVQDRLKQLRREEIAGEKREFSFGSTLSGMGAKEKDLLGDGSIRKIISKAGDGGKWLNEDWLRWDSATKCVAHARFCLVSAGETKASSSTPVRLSFILGDPEMHEGMTVAIKSMTQGEEAQFTFAASRLQVEQSALTKALPATKGQTSVWEITFEKFVTWEDLDRNGERLRKIPSEGYGRKPEPLAEVHVHWRVFGPDATLIHSTRYTMNVGGEGGLKQTEDEEKDAIQYVFGENTWEPITQICGWLRQGGVGELRMRRLPELPKEESDGNANPSAQLSMMMHKAKGPEALQHCVVRAELERVLAPVAGPGDPRWEGFGALVQERFRAEQLLEQGKELAALVRLRRVIAWAERLLELAAEPEATVDVEVSMDELAAGRASVGWVLACRAAPVLDSGNVTSDVLAVARKDLAEAEGHCLWLEERRPQLAGTRLLRAKILVAQDDDFSGAHRQLLEAQKVSPSDKRVQEELKRVKVELRKQEELESRAKVVDLRDRLKKARTGSDDSASEGSREASVLTLLQELSTTKVSWETVMETRIGVELKNCQDGCGEDVRKLCVEILGRLKDESKEQRPMWDS